MKEFFIGLLITFGGLLGVIIIALAIVGLLLVAELLAEPFREID